MYALAGTLPTSLSNVLEVNEPVVIGDLEITLRLAMMRTIRVVFL